MKLLPLANLIVTPDVFEAGILTEEVLPFVSRHRGGEWGELPVPDSELQTLMAMSTTIDPGTMFMSIWRIRDRTIWIVTNYGTSTTIILQKE